MSGSQGKGNRGGGKRQPLPRPVQISKKLSWLLRHGAEQEGLQLDSSGFINLASVLSNRNLRSLKVSFDEVHQIVAENDKQRFTLVPVSTEASSAEANTDGEDGVAVNEPSQIPLESEDPNDWKIRANQGHSLKLDSESLLTPITIESEDFPSTAVHGTTHSAWPLIIATGGLKHMNRNHVHFASGLPAGFRSIADIDEGKDNDDADGSSTAVTASPPVISGMRNSSTILIFLDVRKAMAAGLKFWKSDNGVILTEGDEYGLVRLEFFKRVEDRTGEGVLVEDGKVVKDAPKEWGVKGKGKGKGKG